MYDFCSDKWGLSRQESRCLYWVTFKCRWVNRRGQKRGRVKYPGHVEYPARWVRRAVGLNSLRVVRIGGGSRGLNRGVERHETLALL